MDFTFLNVSGEVAFFRSDAQEAEWTQEELSLHCTFPYIPKKTIERGMTILFRDPATNSWQAYEIRQCVLFQSEGYQQFTAEDIAISELTDCHIEDRIELTDVSARDALSRALSGTGWNVGDVGSSNVSSGDLDRGSVWQSISVVTSNWNVYIMPRVTVGSSGITGRYLDIISTKGTFRGVRLAISKNVTDPCVTYDDTGLYTALYGYGGTYSVGEGESRETKEYTFANVSWSKTSDHPAKPAGQKYLEYPEMTKKYGRRGKPRFGYYQNVAIKDPAVLLQKTWEALKICSEPMISITGTVTDLKRLGYKDEPLRLHDLAIVDLDGLMFYRQIVQLTVNLIEPSKNLPTIGSYIPNIIFINRETENYATGGSTGVGRGGGGGGRSKTDLAMSEYETSIYDTGREVGMYARKVDEQGNILNQAGMHIDPVTGVLIYADDNENMVGARFNVTSKAISSEVSARKEADKELNTAIRQTAKDITLEVNERKDAYNKLESRIKVQADQISLVVKKKGSGYVVDAASIVMGINAQTGSYIKLDAKTIDLHGYVRADELSAEIADLTDVTMNYVTITAGLMDCPYIGATEAIIDDFQCDSLIFDSQYVSWKSKTIRSLNLGPAHNFVYKSGNTEYTSSGRIVLDYQDDTIYYLGR